MFGGNFAPRGWALCDGQLLAIQSNSALFSIIGTIYGGDGRTTFALPDLRGRTPIHAGTGPGLPTYRLGQKVGVAENYISVNQMPPHNHRLLGSSNDAGQATAANGFLPSSARGGTNRYATSIGTQEVMGNSIGNTGAGMPVNNMQPSLSVNYIIALQGVFPSRS